MLEVIFLAVALSMDVFAVSIGLGVTNNARFDDGIGRKRLVGVLIIAFYFASFHALFPLLGYLGGVTLFAWFENVSQWIGFAILLGLGLKAIYDSLQDSDDELNHLLTHAALLILAFATSIDAFATGFTFALLSVSPLISCVIIGLTTFCFSLLGLYLGNSSSERFASISTLFGGVILIAIGFKILLF